MKITEKQYQRVDHLFPVARGGGKLTNLTVLNAVLYLAEQGYKRRALPERFGPWHTVYMRWQRRNERGLRVRVFAELPELGLPAEAWAVLGLDSTSVKVHPDATGAPKKGAAGPGAVPRRPERQRARNGGRRRRCPDGDPVAGASPRRSGETETADFARAAGEAGLSADGSGLRGGGYPCGPMDPGQQLRLGPTRGRLPASWPGTWAIGR